MPDAFALSVYDIAWTLARAYFNTEDSQDIEAFKNQFVLSAQQLDGITGSTELNDAGDRNFANFDFWGVREEDGLFIWKKVGFLMLQITTLQSLNELLGPGNVFF